MRTITGKEVEQYLYSLVPERDEVLAQIEREAQARSIPIVGPAVGRLLWLLARVSGAKRVFEMGSAVGYSTIWLARGAGEGANIVYTDGDRKNAAEAGGYFERAGVAEQIEIQVGDALELLSERKPGEFDLIFNDVDKEDYPRVLRLAIPRLRSGGLFVTDNVLWSGRVTLPGEEQDETTRAIVEFNRELFASQKMFATMIPLRDGLAVAVKV